MAVRNEKETPRKATREPEKRMSKTETPRRTGGGGSANQYGAGGSLDGGMRKASREPEKRMSRTETPRRTGGGGSADLYGTGGSLNGGVRKTSVEPERRMNRMETPRTMQEAHKEMRRRIAEDHKQSISRARKK